MKKNLFKKSIVIGIIFLFIGLSLLINTNAYIICKHKKQEIIALSNQKCFADDILVGTITVNNDNVRVKCLDKIYETKSKTSVNINFRVDYEMVGYGEMSCGIYIKSWEEKNAEVTKPSNWDRDDGIIRLEMEVEPKDSYTIVLWGTNGDDYDEFDAIVEVIQGRGKYVINNIVFQILEIFPILYNVLY